MWSRRIAEEVDLSQPGYRPGYPILDLNRHGRDLKKYVRDLEQAIIGTLGRFDLNGERIDGLTGVG